MKRSIITAYINKSDLSAPELDEVNAVLQRLNYTGPIPKADEPGLLVFEHKGPLEDIPRMEEGAQARLEDELAKSGINCKPIVRAELL